MSSAGQKSGGDWVGDRVYYSDCLPLAWLPDGTDPRPNTQLMDDAQRLLSTCAMLEETRHRNEDSNGVEAEIERLQQKLNLVLEMVGALVVAQQARPAPVPVSLSSEGLLWLGDAANLNTGSSGLVCLHLHRALVQPLVLPATIVHAGGGEISARFQRLNPACQSELERHVFLRHRRAIAGSRSPQSR